LQGKSVALAGVSVRFDRTTAVEPLDLAITPGEFFSILGPSGCGKTTLLRVMAGFLKPTTGRVLIDGADVTGLGPSRRPTAMIFQSLALFPHMSVADNVAFGLEARGVPLAERRGRAAALLDLVALSDFAARRPAELSGGQRQRVAIARALAVEPAVLLLDEPLSALDLKLRQHMRAELRQIQSRTRVTFIYITHDQGEALAMSDRIAVMSRGRIEQLGAPAALYDDPATPFVATFLGEQNAVEGRVTALAADGTAEIETPLGPMRGRARAGLAIGSAATLMIRPERVWLSDPGASSHGDVNRIRAMLTTRVLEGATETLGFSAGHQRLAVARVTQRGDLAGGADALAFDAADALVFPAAAAVPEPVP
jgi:spermidine/putrescine transport system ATP-binding protein